MTNQDYINNMTRLKEIEETVKNPESGLDKIDALIDEAVKLRDECLAFTRGLKDKIQKLADPAPFNL